jgi:integrase
MRIEQGIKEVQYKTKDGTKVKFRVRKKTKEFDVDKLFDTLREARDFRNLINSKDGQLAVTEFGVKAKAAEDALQIQLDSPPLRTYLGNYHTSFLKDESTPTKKRSSKAYLSRLNTVADTKVPIVRREITGLQAILRKHVKDREEVCLGDLKLTEINPMIATDFIRKRLETCKIITVKTDVAMMQSFFNKLELIDPKIASMIKVNPFEKADHSKLKDRGKKRRVRLSEDEEARMFKALMECTNIEMPQIVALAVTTGMRKGEVLELQWKDVKENVIETTGKKGYREVVLNDDSRAVLAAIKRVDANLFHYTSDGFDSNWFRARIRAGITHIRFHDLRREAISRLIESIANPLVISEMTSLKDADHIQRAYIQPMLDDEAAKHGIQTEAQAMRSVGHTTRRMSAVYYTRKPSK